MIDIKNQNIRNIIKNRLSSIRKEIKEEHSNCLNISDLDNLSKEIRNSYKEALATRYDVIHEQAAFASLHIMSCFTLAKAIFDENEDKGYLLPDNWFNGEKDINPNRIISYLILSLAKTSTSVVYLCESGFDNQARSLGRNLAELSWQTLILTFFKEKLLLYISPDNPKEANEVWFMLFGKGKFESNLKEIERGLGFSEEILQTTKELREEIFQFYSMFLHNSYVAVTINNYSFSLQDDSVTSCDFASKSKTSIATLQYLNDILWYFHRVFYSIVFEYHKLRPLKPKRKMWIQARVLHDCTNECYMKLLKNRG